MTSWRRFTLAAITTVSLQTIAPGQESLPKWDFSLWTAAATGEENTNSFAEAQLLKAGVCLGRTIAHQDSGRWAGNFEYAFSLTPLFLQLRPQFLHGVGFEPVILRWNLDHHFARAAPYIELAGGGLYTNLNLPAGNTSNFNFTAKGGAGVYLPAKDRSRFDVRLSWSHISNANLGVRNPEFNGIELGLAYHWLR
jgi:Lipid A 3-O-deacylase (PagL)